MPSDSEVQREPAITVEDLHISYRTTFESPTLRATLLGRMRPGGRRQFREIQALRGVSFEVPHGSVFGIVGSNGAGKSTVMRAMAGILPPTKGRIIVNGRVSTLLALGVGLNATLSGRENVILGGLAAGLTRAQVEAKFAEIAEFADLGDFMDLPMRTYSSGMYSRLAFSVAVHMEPDILLVDEALSAGDAAFKEKATAKMKALCDRAGTLVLVTHGIATVTEMCTHAAWLNKGELKLIGSPQEVVDSYTKFVRVRKTAAAMEDI